MDTKGCEIGSRDNLWQISFAVLSAHWSLDGQAWLNVGVNSRELNNRSCFLLVPVCHCASRPEGAWDFNYQPRNRVFLPPRASCASQLTGSAPALTAHLAQGPFLGTFNWCCHWQQRQKSGRVRKLSLLQVFLKIFQKKRQRERFGQGTGKITLTEKRRDQTGVFLAKGKGIW